MRNYARAAAVAVTAAILSACGGGGGSNPLAPTNTTAAYSSSALIGAASPLPGGSTPSPSSTHSPLPSSQSSTRTVTANQYGPLHAPTMEQLPGNYQTTQAGWNKVGRYVTYLMTDKRAARYAANAGMKPGFYSDVIKIPITQAGMYPESAFAHSCDGQRVYTETSGTAAYLGNPGDPSLLNAWNANIRSMTSDQWGSYPYSWVMSDDSDDPGRLWNLALYTKNNPGGAVSPGVYCGYSSQNFVNQISYLMGHAALPVIFNGDTDPSYYAYMNNNNNVIGGECEGCISSPYLGNGQTKVTGSTWLDHMNAGLTNVVNHKIFFLSANGNVPSDTLGYTYASYMLMYDQNYTMFRQDGPSNSGMGNPPLVNIVPTQQLIPTPSNIQELNMGGLYAREYAACYISGSYVGPCTALVNPDTVYHEWPWLTREYHHLVQFGGNGAATAFGDTGWVNANGPHPGSGLNPGSWVIAFN